jgi:hypothetical protein
VSSAAPAGGHHSTSPVTHDSVGAAANAPYFAAGWTAGWNVAAPCAAGLHPAPVVSLPLPWTWAAARAARDVVRRSLAAAGLTAAVAETAELLISELVGNAVRHATAPLSLELAYHQAVRCSVGDGSRARPRLLDASPMCEGGRGLTMVEALSEQWGSCPTPWGKTVWFDLAVPTTAATGTAFGQGAR